jgi:hypothetical protein
MSRADVAVVVPTCRGYKIPSQDIPVDWIIVRDSPERKVSSVNNNWRQYEETPPVSSVLNSYEVDQYRSVFAPRLAVSLIAPDPCIYGQNTSAIRSAGLDWAYEANYKYILSLDDDCFLKDDWARSHVQALSGLVSLGNSTFPGQCIRGFPNGAHPVGISHGLWSGVLDYPAWYQLAANPKPMETEDKGWDKINAPFPMCGMNVGFRREVLPAVYFQHTFLRHDDIFAGWMAQRVLTLHGYGFVNGGAVVRHERASNAKVNLEKERPGDEINTQLLEHILGFNNPASDVGGTYLRLVDHLASFRMGDRILDSKIEQMVNSMADWAKRRQA